MNISKILLLSVVLAASVARAECAAGKETVTVQVRLQHPSNDDSNIAGVVMSVLYPADKLVIEGRGQDVARAALSGLSDGVNVFTEDRDGELRLLFGKPTPLTVDPLCKITFHRCEGVKAAGPADVSCRVTDASDPGANAIANLRCVIGSDPS